MLGEPIEGMIARVQREREAAEVARRASGGAAGAAGGGVATAAAGQAAAGPAAGRGAKEALWVSRYCASRFGELLSEERTSRDILRWLKSWDECVFGRRPSEAQRRAWAAEAERVAGMDEGWAKREAGQRARLLPQEDGRPADRIVLVAGPPGLGKTTLAHVVARHAGYAPYEVNASDDRSAGALRARLADALNSGSVLGDGRPRCLIVDEVDGSQGGSDGAAGCLLQLLQHDTLAKQYRQRAEEDAGGVGDEETEAEAGGGTFTRAKGKGRGGRVKRGQRLMRPIICICNDVYAPALRQLRREARVFVMEEPRRSRLVSRLAEVCAAEGVQADTLVLNQLAAMAGDDVRTCLNTLQFAHRAHGGRVDLALLKRMNVGAKDGTKSVTQALERVFHAPPEAQGRGALASPPDQPGGGGRDQGQPQHVQAFVRMHDALYYGADMDRLVEGCHENYCLVGSSRSSDVVQLKRTAEAAAVLGELDVALTQVGASQNWSLSVPIPSALLRVRALTARTMERPKLRWPLAGAALRRGILVRQAVMDSFLAGAHPAARRMGQAHIAAELVGPLVAIASPPMRSLAASVMKADERRKLDAVVGIMADYGLTYVPRERDTGRGGGERSWNPAGNKSGGIGSGGDGVGSSVVATEGEVVGGFALEPPIDLFLHMGGHPGTFRRLDGAVREMVAHAIEVHKMRKGFHQNDRHGREGDNDNDDVGEEVDEAAAGPQVPTSGQAKTDDLIAQYRAFHQHAATASALVPPVTGRMSIDPTGRASLDGVAALKTVENPFLYKFHEGFTNAVRLRVTVQDWM